MAFLRRAVIDVGTNSVKLLVADVTGNSVVPVLEDSHQTRLGAGFFETQRLQPDAITRTAIAVADFAGKARGLNVLSIRVIATSAARDANNAPDLLTALKNSSGLDVEIISGDREADWAFQGVTTDPALSDQPLLLLDLGGGSTEFILGHGAQKSFRHSFQLGTVRLMEKCPVTDPPSAAHFSSCEQAVSDFLLREIAPLLKPALDQFPTRPLLIGTGGTASILARMAGRLDSFERNLIDAIVVPATSIADLNKSLWGKTLADRKTLVGLPPNRADVILYGLMIFSGIVKQFGFPSMRISTRGLRFAALMSPPAA